MKLVIGHYHLNRGGVTRVIQNQLLALDHVLDECGTHDALILYGGRAQDWPYEFSDRLRRIRLRLQALPELDYDSEGSASKEHLPSRLMKTLRDAGFGPGETVVHLHNHSIGKNAALPRAVWDLAGRGYRLLLQIHDFAEDQRPGNFQLLARNSGHETDWHGRLYPQAANVHFAVLNGRDRGILQTVGIPDERLHFLPNPVLPLEDLPDREAARDKLTKRFSLPADARLLVYPVRGIRRKNLGEALLHSLVAPEGTFVGLTLPPLNPVELPRYEAWKAAAWRWQPPFRFELGARGGLTFGESLAASDGILTTSVAEGFGMVFLETWLADRELMGRDLPEITQDFTAAGLDLSRLNRRLDIPADWLNLPQARETLLEGFRQTLAAYGRTEPADLVEQVDAKLRAETIDFGDLDEGLQTSVIDRVVREKRKGDITDFRGREDTDSPEAIAARVEANAQVVRRDFSLLPSGKRLAAVYDAILNSPRDGDLQPLARPGAILDRFLDFTRFRLLRS